MEKASYHNLFAVLTGVLMITSGCLIAYFSQKNLFNKYHEKSPNIVDKKPSTKP